MKTALLSDGAWGTALASVLIKNGHEVVMWGPFPDYLETMRQCGENTRFLPGIKLPEKLQFEADMGKAVDGAEMILLATPTQYLRGVLQKFAPFFRKDKQIILNVAKGIEKNTNLPVSGITRSELGESRYVVLSGPSHAEEVIREKPTLTVAASKDAEAAKFVQDAFMNRTFRVYTSSDTIGVELGGALKNIIAIGGGIIDGMNLGDNPKAALITRGIAELSRLGVALGGEAATFSGLSGIGDLIVTCCSGHSRNRYVGEELGKGRKLDEIISEMGLMVAEGVPTTSGAYILAKEHNVDTPIINALYSVFYENLSPAEAIDMLMTRSAKPE